MTHCNYRENQLALQLLCKQHEKKETTCCVKSLPVIQRELEHLEDYFMYKQEIDSNENCIVLTCSLGKDAYRFKISCHCKFHTQLNVN